ncbi:MULTISPECIES: hypothetical protein [Pseudomonas]|uniref:hypothetical protein n=1 Tax=Pseudomonas TaxID=286 RepID=UPI002168B248|nr:hypothetical protein [Pseudomonas grimontii]MCS3513118.1 3-hydroxymyristoyl/3-hydroxydecanoyl-(acyl carrier protein) dehydratase [Pseudomonas grimontii]
MSEFEIFRVDHFMVSDSRFEVFFTINTNAVIFTDHFPNFPIVPGACIVGFVIACIEEMDKPMLGLFSLQRVAFLEPITPGLELHLVIDKKIGSGGYEVDRYNFKICQAAINFCRGAINFGVDSQ